MAKYPLQTALELTELGRQLVAQKHRRTHPDATEEEVAAVVGEWMSDRSLAPFGDGVGTAIPWPRDH